MKSFTTYLTTALVVLLGIAGYALFHNLTPFEDQWPAVGQPAPEIVLPDMQGNMLHLSDLRGRIVLLNFWGTWCVACKEEIPGFKKVLQEYQAKGFSVFAVAVGDVPSAVKELNLPYPVAMADRKVTEDYGNVVHIPVSYLIGRDGNILRKIKGLYDEGDLRGHVETVLQGQGT